MDTTGLHEYITRSTSAWSAKLSEPISLRTDERDADARTRRAIRATVVDNQKHPAACLKIDLFHQRRKGLSEEDWEAVDRRPLNKLHTDESVAIQLDSGETLNLYQALKELYAIASRGPVPGEARFTVVSGEMGDLFQRLSAEFEQEAIAELVEAANPSVAELIASRRRESNRRDALEEFEQHLAEDDWQESDWETFFRANQWIMGFGLSYQFLDEVQGQAEYGGSTVTGRGSLIGDSLRATRAAARFTVLVELKKPGSPLLGSQRYRNGAFALGPELTGGVAQVQAQCHTWAIDGARRDENRDLLEGIGIFTFEPKGILIIGHTEQVRGDRERRRTFELYRRSIHNPEIVTYDELLERARAFVHGDGSTQL